MADVVAVLIAAGLGSRLLPYTEQLPKCMLDVQGSSILHRALTTFHDAGVSRLVVVGGYKADRLNLPSGCALVMNSDYENNNILHSLACARDQMDDAATTIICYSDIIFRKSVVEKLIDDQNAEISIVVDQQWAPRYDGRILHPLSQAEAARFNVQQELLQTGKDLLSSDHDSSYWGEFIGMMKITRRGREEFWKVFDDVHSKLHLDDPFQGAPAWRSAYITDLLQELVDRGVKINCSLIQGGWLEIDTTEDYQESADFDFSEPTTVATSISEANLQRDGC